jgi:hypothetical protein
MSSREAEIIEKFHQLSRDEKLRVRELIAQETDVSAFDYDAWFRDVEALRQQISIGDVGTLPAIDVVDILRSIRDGDDE